jgi:hypothetical protein
MKPLGHYTSHTPGDGSILDSLVEKYGSTFSEMDEFTKWLIFHRIVLQFAKKLKPNTFDDEVSLSIKITKEQYELLNQIDQLTESEQLGLLTALIAQLYLNHFKTYTNAEFIAKNNCCPE